MAADDWVVDAVVATVAEIEPGIGVEDWGLDVVVVTKIKSDTDALSYVCVRSTVRKWVELRCDLYDVVSFWSYST